MRELFLRGLVRITCETSWKNKFCGQEFLSLTLCGEIFPVAQMVKNLPAMQEILGSIPGSGRSSGEGNGNPLQYSCLENPMDRGAWRAMVREVAKRWTRLSD